MDTRETSHNELNHVYYEKSRISVCQKPQLMDNYPVVERIKNLNKPLCKECSDILYATSRRLEQATMAKINATMAEINATMNNEKLATSRGVAWGFFFASIFWAVAGLILWVVFF